MITTPDRLTAVVAAIERGEPVDLKKVQTLQALDLAHIGRQFVREAIKRDEEADVAVQRWLDEEWRR